MSNLKAEILFNGSGLDTDSSYEFVIQGDAPYRKNVLVGEDGSNGVITQMKGAHKGSVSYPLTLAEVYQVVGSYYNRLTRKCYYWVFSLPYDSTLSDDYLYDNKLLCYNEDLGTIDCIFTDTHNYMGLHFNYFMKDCAMIGDWLFFNPKVSEPKMIDVTRAYNYENYDVWQGAPITYAYGDKVTYYGGLWLCLVATNAGESPVTHTAKWERIGDAYQDETLLDFNSEFRYAFNVIKMPPVGRPIVAYGTDTEILSNNVRGRIGRFAYRYKYFDNTYSVYSNFTDVILPVDEEQWNGEVVGDTSLNNYIGVTVSLHSPALVKEAEIIYQETGGDWKQIKTIHRQEQEELTTNNFTFNFYNNEAYAIVDSTLVYKVEDAVPRTAFAQEIINKNILTYGRCKEGFENLPKNDITVTLTPELQVMPEVPGIAAFKRNNLGNDISTLALWDGTTSTWTYYTVIDVSGYAAWGGGVADGDMYSLLVNGSFGFVTFGAADVVSANALATAMSPACTNTDVTTLIDGNNFMLGSKYTYPEVTASLFYTPVGVTSNIVKARGFKTGANHPFCIFYYDDNLRRWEAQTSKENLHGVGYEMLGTTVYVPTFNEVSSPMIDGTNYRWEIDWTVNHLPPDGAKYWQWGYAGNTLCSWFVQYVVTSIENGIGTEAEMTLIDITPLQTLKSTVTATWNQFPQSNIDPYSWEKGDRVRVITHKMDPYVAGMTTGDVIDVMLDYEIIKQDDATNLIYIQKIDDLAVLNLGYNTVIEIYRPRKTDTKTEFYAFGALMPIVEDSLGVMVHGSIGVNQKTSTVTPASGTFRSGDVYHIYRTPSQPFGIAGSTGGAVHETLAWSDFYDSDDWDKGKPGTETNFGERTLNIIRFSNQYLQNTQINGLSTFEGDNYKELNDIYGDIMAMMEIGNTLKVYQERKPSSILIGRQEYTDADGNMTVATSDRVLGSIRYSTTNWGTEFPESLSRNNRYVYGYDILNGVIWRDSANGIFPISGRYEEAGQSSDYKMATYFKEKSKTLMLSGIANIRVLSVWDEEYKLLYISFCDLINEENNDIVVFHEPSNRWITFAQLESIDHGGYNQFLELTYDVITGFEGGIGFDFDDDTRFAIFTMVTTAGAVGYFDTLELTLTPYTPSVLVDSMPSQDLNNLLLTPNTPDVTITYVHISVNDMVWDADEGGSGVNETTVITCEPTYCNLQSFPDWITVANFLYDVIDTEYQIATSDTIRIYPSTINYGVQRTGYVVFENKSGDTATVTVTQNAAVAIPNVTVQLDPVDASGMTLASASGYNIDNSYDVYITFTPNHPLYSAYEEFQITWTATKNGTFAGNGLITATDETVNGDVHLVMGVTAYTTDTIIVYLSGDSLV